MTVTPQIQPIPSTGYDKRRAQDSYLATQRQVGGDTGREVYDFLEFASGDLTPDVSVGGNFVTANAVPTIITDLDGGVRGQRVTIEINDANTTIDFTSSGMKGNGGVDWSPVSGDHMTCVHNGTEWLCAVSENISGGVSSGGGLAVTDTDYLRSKDFTYVAGDLTQIDYPDGSGYRELAYSGGDLSTIKRYTAGAVLLWTKTMTYDGSGDLTDSDVT